MQKYTIQFQVECERSNLFLVPPRELSKDGRLQFAIESMLQNPIEHALIKLVKELGINNIANIGVVLGEAHLTKSPLTGDKHE